MNEILNTNTALYKGKTAEKMSLDYLTGLGLKYIASNYSCKCGEIDIIMQDKDDIVFVEVRARNIEDYGGGLESITKAKQDKIIRTAQYYLIANKLFDKVQCRFDVVIVNLYKNSEIMWIKNAFWVQY